MNKYQELEQQIQTLQEEHQKRVQKLQEQVELLKKEESELPAEFDREQVINFLNNPDENDLAESFCWESTSEGWNYWYNISDTYSQEMPEEAIIQLQKWVIQSYQEQYEV